MGPWLSSRGVALCAVAGFSLVGVLSAPACEGGAGGGAPGVGGGGGGGGAPGCPEAVAPLFTLRIAAAEGSLPDDLQVQVSWSAGDEPVVQVADEASYGTPEDNVVCARNVAAATSTSSGGTTGTGADGGVTDSSSTTGVGGAGAVDELLCELWTSGPTRVRLEALGYLPFDETLPPATVDGCNRPVPSEVAIEVVAEEPPEEED